MGIFSYIKNMFVPPISDWNVLVDDFQATHLKQSALNTVLGRITASANLVDFRTTNEALWKLLNVTPNTNDNAKDFRTKLINQLVVEGEVLVVQLKDQWYVADDFQVNDNVLTEKIYSGIVIESLTLKRTFRASEVYHFRYNNPKLRAFLSKLDNDYMNLYSRLLSVQMRQNQLRVYAKFKGINDPTKNKEQESKFESFLSNLKNALENNSVVVSPRNDSYDLEEKTDNYLGRSVDELDKLKNQYIGEVANALQMSPLLFTGELADVEQHEKNAIKYAIRPIFEIITTEISKKYFGKEKSDLIANVTPLTYNNEFEMAKDIEKLVGSAVFTPDDILEKLGKERTGLPEMTKHYLTKNIQPLDMSGE